MCLKFLLRDDFERFIWCLDLWLCFMFDCIHVLFFSSWKTIFKSLLDTSSTPGYLLSFLDFFSYHNLDTSLTPGGSIKKVPVSSIASRQLGRSIELLFLIWWVFPRHLHLLTAICSTPTSIDVSTPLDTFIFWDLLMAYIFSSCDPQLIFVDLSLNTSIFHLLNLSHSLQTSSLGILKLFQVFLHLVSFYSPSFTCISCFET